MSLGNLSKLINMHKRLVSDDYAIVEPRVTEETSLSWGMLLFSNANYLNLNDYSQIKYTDHCSYIDDYRTFLEIWTPANYGPTVQQMPIDMFAEKTCYFS